MKELTIENLKVHTFTPNDVLVLSVPIEYTQPEPMEGIRKTLDELEIDLEKQFGFKITCIIKPDNMTFEVFRAKQLELTEEEAVTLEVAERHLPND